MGKLSFISSSNVGKLIAKLLIAFTLFLIIDNVLYFILERNSREHAVGTFYSFLKVLHTQPKIVILGASAAQNHYVAPLIAANTQSTVYNFGIGGATFLVQYSQIIEILKIYRPELIIYDIGSNPLDPYYEKGPSLEYLQLFPDNRYLSLARKKHDQLYQISRVFKIIKYNRVASMIAISMLKPDSKNNIDNMLGYRPIYESRLPDLLRQGKINDDVDDHYNRSQLLHNAFVDLMKLVRSHDVNMVFIRSPFYSHDNSVTKLEVDPTVLYEIRRFGFTFYDLSKTNREEFHNAKYYKDFGHLTDQGARIFTNMITPIVKGYLSNNERKMKL